MHVLMPRWCTRPLVGGTCSASSTCNGSNPEDPCHFQPPLQQQTSGGRFWRDPNCFDVSRLVVPGGARHTWGAAQASIDHPVGPHLFLHKPPTMPCLHLKAGKFGNKTGAVSECPNLWRLDQSMQITAATAIAFAFETAKDCWGIVPSSDYLSSE